ncbi:restriction endonuclease subunit S [Flavobacterium sp.]|uniref:restriction endonuclease subunit S n=1 Tax=Flavobacterium sp. TaxID=239 RepID=UPI003F6A46B8
MIKYEKYKPSDIDWLGEIPQNWELKRVKDIINKIGSGVTPKGGSEVYVDVGVPLIRSQNVYDDGLRLDDVSFIDEETNNKMKSSQLKQNDILINITGASIGRSCVVPKNIEIANINQHIIYLRVKEKYVPFIAYYIKSNVVKEYINLIQAGTSKEALNMGQAINIPVVIPDFNTQNTIVSFIENKTQAIDKKINLLIQKANCYKEYRKSIINKAVCKGLNKNVIFKNSDINYINDIPEHWKIERIKDLFNIGRGRVIGQELLVEEGKYPVYSSQTENNGCLGYIETYDFNNDLLTWTTDGANAGTVFRRSGKFNCTNVCGTLIPKRKNLDLDYVVYALQESATHNKRIDTNGAKIMNNEMAVINIAFPPLKEQTEIAKYLDIKTQTTDKIVENINTQIITLKELRKTLINDVVTGKIKVTQD